MKQYRRKNATVSRTSPKGGRRGCLCPDGKTYSSKCCDGTLEAQGIGNITLSGVDSAGTIVSQDTTSTVSSTSTALPSQGSSTVTSQDTTNTTVNSSSTQVVSMEITSGTYNVGDSLPLVATFNEEVNVDTTGGTPTVDVNIDENTREFSYTQGSGTDDLTFEYTLVEEDAEFTTAEVASDIELNGGSITDGGGDPIETTTESITVTVESVIVEAPVQDYSDVYYVGVNDLCVGGSNNRFLDTTVCGTDIAHFSTSDILFVGSGQSLPKIGDIAYNPRSSEPYYIEGVNSIYSSNSAWWLSIKDTPSTCGSPSAIEFMVRVGADGTVLETHTC